MAKRGQPSKYEERFCDALINHMSEGLSFESFGAHVPCDRDTLYEWAKVHPEFSDAKKLGVLASLYFWEQLGVDGIKGKYKFNAAAWIFTMKCRFRDFGYKEEVLPLPADQMKEVKDSVTELGNKILEATGKIKKGQSSER